MKAIEAQIDPCGTDDIIVKIPLTITELGFKRHYHLSSESLLEKRVLILCDSPSLAQAVSEFFGYFNYEVTIRTQGNVLFSTYDIVVVEQRASNTFLLENIAKAQQQTDLECIWIDESNEAGNSGAITALHIQKPVTQEMIFDAIESLGSQKTPAKPATIQKSAGDVQIAEQESEFRQALNALLGSKKSTLDSALGIERAKANRLKYPKALRIFVDQHGRADFVLREMLREYLSDSKHLNDVQRNEIEQFAYRLYEDAEAIGAMETANIASAIQMTLHYGRYDRLDLFPGKLHVELGKLQTEIATHL
jgi:hypothetical protein